MDGLIKIEKWTDPRGERQPVLVIKAKGTARSGLFNPREVSVQKTVNWKEGGGRRLDHPGLSFEGGSSRTLTLSLLLDSYEDETQKDVRTHTNKLAQLARVDDSLHRPPVCLISWGPTTGGLADLPFRGVVTGLTQKFTLFLSDGTPVRATVDMTLREYEPISRQTGGRSSPDRTKSRLVRRGDSLWAIAAAEYDEPTKWRPIALANHIDNPRELLPGTTLVIPPLE